MTMQFSRGVVAENSGFDQQFSSLDDKAILDKNVQEKLDEFLTKTAEGWAVTAETTTVAEASATKLRQSGSETAVRENASLIERLTKEIADNRSSWFHCVVFLLVWILMLGGEWVLNQMLAYLATAATVLATLALAGAPTLTPLILDQVVGALFGREPWTAGVEQPKSRKFLLAVVGVANLAAVGLVGGCRSLVAIIQQHAVALTPDQNHFVNTALIVLGIVLAIDAALVFLYLSHELRGVNAKHRAEQELKEAKKAKSALDAALLADQKSAIVAAQRLDNMEKEVDAFKEEFLASRRLKIAARIAALVQSNNYKSVVEMREKQKFFRDTEIAA